jgi:hypothetical protein
MAAGVQPPFQGHLEVWMMFAVVSRNERPQLDAFEAFLAAADTSEAEQQAIQQYSALMQQCWAGDPAMRPHLKQVEDLWPLL